MGRRERERDEYRTDGGENGDDGEPTGIAGPSDVTVRAEWDELQAVRLHEPGFETFAGTLDSEPNLFLKDFSLFEARSAHDELVEALESYFDAHEDDEDDEADVGGVHYLHEDLDRGGTMGRVLSSHVSFDLSEMDAGRRARKRDELWASLHDATAYDRLQAVATNATVVRHEPEGGVTSGSNPDRDYAGSMTADRPLSCLLFQRDQQFVTKEGVVICSMNKNTRRGETGIARAAWEGLENVLREKADEAGDDGDEDAETDDDDGEDDEDIVVADLSTVDDHHVPEGIKEHAGVQSTEVHVEGGDFYPAGDYCLLGVSAKIPEGEEHVYSEHDIEEDDTELVFRTTYAAGHKLLEEDAFGTNEVALVRAPFLAAKGEKEGQEKEEVKDFYDEEFDMAAMHLDTWFNYVREDLVVAHEPLLKTEVDVYERAGENDDYERDRTKSFEGYLEEEDHDVEVKGVVEHFKQKKEKGVDDEKVDEALKAVTNFLTLESGTILPFRFGGEGDDEDDPDRLMEEFLEEKLEEKHDVTILPENETGIEIDSLRAGYGSIHCLTTPISRRQ